MAEPLGNRCEQCDGSGEIISDVSKYLGLEPCPCAYECPACRGSGRRAT